MKSECDEVWLKFSIMCMVENFHYISVTLGHMKTSSCLFYCCTENLTFFNFWRTHVLFVGPLIPLFWTSGDVCPGFQSQGGSRLHAFLPASYSSDSPLVWHLLTAWQPAWRPVTLPTCISRGRMLGFERGISHSEQRCSTHLGRLYHPIFSLIERKGSCWMQFQSQWNEDFIPNFNRKYLIYKIYLFTVLWKIKCNEMYFQSVMKKLG